MWEGLKEYAISGTTPAVPLRLPRGPHPPPQPDEGQHGATRARLIKDPERARGHEDVPVAVYVLSPDSIARPDNRSPRARARHPWSPGTSARSWPTPSTPARLSSPHPQHRRPPRRAEDTQGPPRALTWPATTTPTRPSWHGTVETPSAAASTQRPRPPDTPRAPTPATSRIRCAQCSLRMCAKPNRACNGKTYLYWYAPTTEQRPPRRQEPPTSAPVTDHDITAAVDHIINDARHDAPFCPSIHYLQNSVRVPHHSVPTPRRAGRYAAFAGFGGW